MLVICNQQIAISHLFDHFYTATELEKATERREVENYRVSKKTREKSKEKQVKRKG